MANIVVAWELGAGLGHLSYLSIIINRLSDLGHQLTLVLNDPSNIGFFDLPDSLLILPAPSFKTLGPKNQHTVSLPCILRNRGFQGPKVLSGIVRCWEGIFQVTEPDLIFFDYAPSAMLAARGLDCPKVLVGSGFSELEPNEPGLIMRPDKKGASHIAKASELYIVECINQVCVKLGYQKVRYLSDLYTCDLNLITCLPDLDLYKRDMSKCLYFDFTSNRPDYESFSWLKGNRKKVFVYLTVGKRGTSSILSALTNQQYDVICYCSGMSNSLFQRYSRMGLRISREPLNSEVLLNDADLVICHAGKGMIAKSLKNGAPLLLLPTHMEQRLNMTCVEHLGAGLGINADVDTQAIHARVDRLLNDPIYRSKAKAIAEKTNLEAGFVGEVEVIQRITSLLK